MFHSRFATSSRPPVQLMSPRLYKMQKKRILTCTCWTTLTQPHPGPWDFSVGFNPSHGNRCRFIWPPPSSPCQLFVSFPPMLLLFVVPDPWSLIPWSLSSQSVACLCQARHGLQYLPAGQRWIWIFGPFFALPCSFALLIEAGRALSCCNFECWGRRRDKVRIHML